MFSYRSSKRCTAFTCARAAQANDKKRAVREITNVRLGLQFNFRYMNEFHATNRFRGNSYSLNLGYTIKKPKPGTPASP